MVIGHPLQYQPHSPTLTKMKSKETDIVADSIVRDFVNGDQFSLGIRNLNSPNDVSSSSSTNIQTQSTSDGKDYVFPNRFEILNDEEDIKDPSTKSEVNLERDDSNADATGKDKNVKVQIKSNKHLESTTVKKNAKGKQGKKSQSKYARLDNDETPLTFPWTAFGSWATRDVVDLLILLITPESRLYILWLPIQQLSCVRMGNLMHLEIALVICFAADFSSADAPTTFCCLCGDLARSYPTRRRNLSAQGSSAPSLFVHPMSRSAVKFSLLCLLFSLFCRHSSQLVNPSRAKQISSKPRAFVYEGFLTDEECDHLISLAKSELKRSAVADNLSGKSTLSDVRTSSGMFISKAKDDIVLGIEQKIAAWTFLPKVVKAVFPPRIVRDEVDRLGTIGAGGEEIVKKSVISSVRTWKGRDELDREFRLDDLVHALVQRRSSRDDPA
ncbi:prolyl 4-hydroxylase [Dendrobium catenatum]|uniref:Prolyl 4-hydroxylase n=1 Tax=Dendrobium catenatum TaxID=906689 RepID=A0A2I0W2E4_9ASPA|nr:prolyl 4-hydroxylase [Dendrobium catenatum]